MKAFKSFHLLIKTVYKLILNHNDGKIILYLIFRFDIEYLLS